MAISRMPVTLSDVSSPRYKSSVSKLRKLCPHSGTIPKLSAMRQAFSRALGYGSENELRVFAEDLGQYYIDSPLNISEVITSVSQRLARQWNITIGSAESIASELGLQHFDACRPVVRSNHQKNEMVNSPATNDSSSDEASVVLPKSSLAEDKPPISIGQLDRLTSGNPIQAELDRLGTFSLGAAGLGSSPFKHLNESPAMKAIAKLNENPAMKAIAELNESPALRAIREFNDSPTMRAIKDLQAGSVFAKVDRLNANPALVALDRLYAIPAVAERLSQTDVDMED